MAALRVFTDASLIQSLAQFAPGGSFAAFQLRQRLVCARCDWSGKPAPADIALWEAAIRAGDRRTLAALRDLWETAALGWRLRRTLAGNLESAIAHAADVDLLRWLDAIGLFSRSERARRCGTWGEHCTLGARGDVDIARWAIVGQGFAVGVTVMESAAEHGHLALVAFVLNCVQDMDGGHKAGVINRAAAHGHLAVVQFLVENMPGTLTAGTNKLLDGAAAGGHLDIVTYLHGLQIAGCSIAAMDSAAAGGHLDVVRFLHEHTDGGCSTVAMDRAATNGHIDVVTFLHEHRSEGCTTVAIDGAVENGHVAVATFLSAHRSEGCSRKALLSAVRADAFDKLQLLSASCGDGALKCAAVLAVELGNLKVVKFLFARGGVDVRCLPREDLVNSAASAGHLELLKFFHAHAHFRFGVRAMHNAAVHGHLHIVKFLHEHRDEGCKVDTLFECDARDLSKVLDFLCSRRPMAKPQAAIARAKREHRTLLAARLERHAQIGDGAAKTYVYRHL